MNRISVDWIDLRSYTIAYTCSEHGEQEEVFAAEQRDTEWYLIVCPNCDAQRKVNLGRWMRGL